MRRFCNLFGIFSLLLCLGSIASSSARADEAPDSASDYLVDLWGTDDGLPNNTVTSIAQTPDGYLWCGTYDGVVRFDGVRFVRVGPDDSTNQQANRVMCLHVDRRGHLWVGTDGAGVMRYRAGEFHAYAEASGSAANAVRSIAEDAAGDLWLGTRGGLGRLRDGKTKWFVDGAGVTNAGKSIWNIGFDRESNLWIADWTGVKVFRNGVFRSPLPRSELQSPVRAFFPEAHGDLWLGMMGKALHQSSDGKWLNFDRTGLLANSEVAAFCRARSGELWIGTRRGLWRVHGDRWTLFPIREGQGMSEVRALFEDQEGNLWIGTGTDGLARIKRRVLKTFTAREGLADGAVHALREKPGGGLVVGLSDGRLALGNGGGFRPFATAALPPNDALVNSVLFTRDGALWIGTFGNGLIRIDAAGGFTRFVPSVGSASRIDKVTALLEGRSGTVWIGTYYSLYKGTSSNVVVQATLGGREVRSPVTALLESRDGSLWVGTHGSGVARVSGPGTNREKSERITWFTRREGLPTDLVRTLHEDAEGALWIGTEAGLACLRNGRTGRITRAQGLTSDTISQILEDDAGNLWLGGNRGILRATKQDLLAVMEGRRNSIEVFACGRGEGMLSLECLGGFYPAGLKTSDGRLWFPTARGLAMIDPLRLDLTKNSLPPPVLVEEIFVDGKRLPATASPGELRASPPALPSAARRLEFNYTAMSLTAPERVRFKHRLEGFDPGWVDAGGARSVIYANLRPGAYRFQVIASNNDGVWNEKGDSFAFRIAAPYWQTGWFLTLAGIAAAGLLAGVVRAVSVRQLRRRLRRLEEAHAIESERTRISQDMHDELGGKLSRISFLSEMARRNVPDQSEASEQMNEVSEAAREVIRTVDEIVWAVSPRNDTLESLTHYICRHADEFFELTEVELELEIPRDFPACRLSAEVRHNLFCAMKEALNNVLKHSGATRVRIAFALVGRSFQVTLTDNGTGFETGHDGHEHLNGSTELMSMRRGNGLINMRERLESVRGKYWLESEPGRGTRAVFTVPL